MTSGPELIDWQSRELGNAALMNARIADVHTWLSNPPAVRVFGKRLEGPSDSPRTLPFHLVGEFGGVSYDSYGGMTSLNGDQVAGLVAPLKGRYRVAFSGTMTTFSSHDSPLSCHFSAAVVNGDSPWAEDIEANAFMRMCPPAASHYTYMSSMTTTISLNAGDTVRFSAVMNGDEYKWADYESSESYKRASFAELRWIGETL